MTRDELIDQIESFALAKGIAPATVTSRAVQNSRLYARLKNGGGCNLLIAEKLRAFMAEHAADDVNPTHSPAEDAA